MEAKPYEPPKDDGIEITQAMLDAGVSRSIDWTGVVGPECGDRTRQLYELAVKEEAERIAAAIDADVLANLANR